MYRDKKGKSATITKESLTKYKYDDGGADKGNGRKHRRELQRMTVTILSFFGLCLLLLVILRSKDERKQEGTKLQHQAVQEKHRRTERDGTIMLDTMELNRKNIDVMSQNDQEEGKEIPVNTKAVREAKDRHSSKPRSYRFTDPHHLPHVPGVASPLDFIQMAMKKRRRDGFKDAKKDNSDAFKKNYRGERQPWENEAELTAGGGPNVDYTTWKYEYPTRLDDPPDMLAETGEYPPMEPLGTILKRWPQDELDNPPSVIVEKLQHFDYNDPHEMEMALAYRDAELPFKLTNVPEIIAAGRKWTDEYLSANFDGKYGMQLRGGGGIPKSKGRAQEGVDNFFSFFNAKNWDISIMGPPPTLDVDFSFAKWAKHARYADAVGLEPDEKHYYWQSGVPKTERLSDKNTWTFVSRDLPGFSDPEPTFFGFLPPKQQGIQCRFGERGVTAATHYDAGRNMIAMISGAKRYILSPPNACPKLGMVVFKKHPAFRHSLLNFGHISLLESGSQDEMDMPSAEREWLEIAKEALTIDTVLKAGEVLYVPSHWFHYITSLQKSAQCNVRSGREMLGTKYFGGMKEVDKCVGT